MTGSSDRGPPPATPPASPYEPVSPWPATAALLITVAIIIASIAASVAVLGAVAAADQPSETRTMMLMAMNQAVMIVLTLIAAGVRRSDTRAVLSMRPPLRGAYDVFFGLLLILGVLAAVNLIAILAFGHDPLADLRQFAGLFKGPNWLFALAVVGIGAPLSEELLFRGFLQSSLTRSSMGFTGGAIVSTVIWTALHAGYSIIGMIEVALIGGALSYLLWRSGSLWVCLICHGLYNAALALYTRFLMT